MAGREDEEALQRYTFVTYQSGRVPIGTTAHLGHS